MVSSGVVVTTDRVITECHNWETQEVVTYERHGECNRCGACCKAGIVLGQIQTMYEDGDPRPKMGLPTINKDGDWTTLAGERSFYQFMDTGKESTCPAYCERNGKGGCNIQDVKSFEQMCCVVFPQAPSQIKTFPDCSYTFTEVGRRDIGREGNYFRR